MGIKTKDDAMFVKFLHLRVRQTWRDVASRIACVGRMRNNNYHEEEAICHFQKELKRAVASAKNLVQILHRCYNRE